ncbi:MAG TPA: response regulator transcription factor [Prolixibacteraceae bacterium]|nr:response regulator transcription factor [Prolixibacteraceae bacterium]
MKILIIEDEAELLSVISSYLSVAGFSCELADRFEVALEKISLYQYDIILLDITLPDGNGLELIKTIKEMNLRSGVIIISAKNSLDDKISGLDLGADDYMTKPFQLSELNSRIKALLRRRHFEGSDLIRFNEIELNTENKTVTIDNILVTLTKKEYDLLLFFLVNKSRLLTKESIAEHLWGDNIDLADNFDFIYTHINNLRKKILSHGGNDYIKTVYGMGYKFVES